MYSDIYSKVLGKLLEGDEDLGKLRDVINKKVKENYESISNIDISEALSFNKKLLMENFILPNKLRLPLSRTTLEKYYL